MGPHVTYLQDDGARSHRGKLSDGAMCERSAAREPAFADSGSRRTSS
jgi:hypothetical protein